jgi:hypothetical protein
MTQWTVTTPTPPVCGETSTPPRADLAPCRARVKMAAEHPASLVFGPAGADSADSADSADTADTIKRNPAVVVAVFALSLHPCRLPVTLSLL